MRPLAYYIRAIEVGVINESFPAHSSARLLKVYAHDDQEVLFMLLHLALDPHPCDPHTRTLASRSRDTIVDRKSNSKRPIGQSISRMKEAGGGALIKHQ